MYMRAETKKSILNARQNEHNRQQKEKEKKQIEKKGTKYKHTQIHPYVVDLNTQRQFQMVKMFSFCCLSALFKLQ